MYVPDYTMAVWVVLAPIVLALIAVGLNLLVSGRDKEDYVLAAVWGVGVLIVAFGFSFAMDRGEYKNEVNDLFERAYVVYLEDDYGAQVPNRVERNTQVVDLTIGGQTSPVECMVSMSEDNYLTTLCEGGVYLTTQTEN